MKHTHHILSIVAVLLFALVARGQNNFYSIDDECYKIMQTLRIYEDTEAEYLRKCNMMYDLAVKKHDAKAQTLAVSNVLTYYDDHKDCEKVRVQAKKLRAEALRTGYMQYYYFAYYREIEHLLYVNMEEAMRLAKQMTLEAEDDPSPYGRFISYQQLGNVYKARHNKTLSRANYEKALEMAPKLATTQRTTMIYISLAELTDDFIQKQQYFKQAMNAALESNDTLRVYSAQCMTYGKFNMKEAFNDCFAKEEELLTRVDFGFSHDIPVRAYKAAFDGDYAKAYKILDEDLSQASAADRLETGIDIATREGDGKKALQFALDLEEFYDQVFVSHRGFEFAEIADLIENERLASQQASQAMQQAQMRLESENMLAELRELDERNQQLAIADAQMDRRNQQAATLNRQYEDSLRNAQTERDYMQKAEAQRKENSLKTMLRVIVAALTVVIVVFLIFILTYRRTSRRLLRYAKVLRRARMEALTAAEMKSVFLQNMSHEMRTPLNAVMGFSQLMAVPGLPLSDEEKKEYGEHILNNSKMLTMLVDDILNIAAIEKGNYSIELATYSANEIMTDAVSTAEYRAQEGVRVYSTSDVDDNYLIVTDARRVQQVLINFLTNACKHTEQGEIHLHLSVSSDQLSYSVTDTGCGIPKDKVETIFERFTKLNDFKQGTGLGLNICRLIATKMGGRVYCDTSYTTGARFVFELPLVKPTC